MKGLVFIVEGDTEVRFIKNKVIPYLLEKTRIFDWDVHPQKICTNRKLNRRGGMVNFEHLRNEVIRCVAGRGNILITTLLDFFRLPNNFPGYTENNPQIEQIEREVRMGIEGVEPSVFYPYIQRHELESLMYISMEGFERVIDDQDKLEQLREIMERYQNPEDINGGPNTAPSKRLITIYPKYQKISDGDLIFDALSIDDIRSKCPRFNGWMSVLEDALQNERFATNT